MSDTSPDMRLDHEDDPQYVGITATGQERYQSILDAGKQDQPDQDGDLERHPSTQHMLSLFGYEHLSEPLKGLSYLFSQLAYHMTDELPDGPELTAGLRKLLEAKDCAVRAKVLQLAGHTGKI